MHPSSRRSNEAQNIPRRRRHRRGAGAHRLRRRAATDDDSSGTAALTIAKPDGAITTESNNPYLGDSSAAKYSVPHGHLRVARPRQPDRRPRHHAVAGRVRGVERRLHPAHRRRPQRREVERRRGLHRRRHRVLVQPGPRRQAQRHERARPQERHRRRRHRHDRLQQLEVHPAGPGAALPDRARAHLERRSRTRTPTR